MKSTKWRIVSYLPSPSQMYSWRVPIGVLLKSNPTVDFIQIPNLPQPSSVGGAASHRNMLYIVDTIKSEARFECVSFSNGHVLLGNVKSFPGSKEEAKEMIQTLLDKWSDKGV